ncbi:hypothetical protein BLA60_38905 [Actinophytocola xinjiangensis]|uniref:Uncharacterized protein n=1 Tax=Actinophytocola xinjiangensis TaxID=485602 RepID=A0A7Z0WDJ2_9PSEU|nr:hypothetical protein [Actinophytocola xinjiangensis]OLF04820.1 hypothetical protein BLA60_38905 [Actinophytocola xinjiangensis]
MIVLEPVLEVVPPEGFALWPVAGIERFGLLALGGGLTEDEIGTAVLGIAAYNHDAGDPHPPTDPLGAFLHGLITVDEPLAAGGLRVTDATAGVTLVPGCCTGLEDRRDWYGVLDGGYGFFGHEPSPSAERHGDTVRLTVDTDLRDSPVIELPAATLRELLAGAERDLTAFLGLVTAWAARHLPEHADPVVSAIARALDLPVREPTAP